MTTIDQEDRDQLIDRLEGYPSHIYSLIDGVNDDALRQAGPGGGWGAVEILCHLRDLEELFLDRVTLMLDEDNPRLQKVEDSLWPIDRDYINQDPHEAFNEFAEYRRQTVHILDNASLQDWSRTGRHPVFGQITVQAYAERVVQRDEEHERQLLEALNQAT